MILYLKQTQLSKEVAGEHWDYSDGTEIIGKELNLK